MIFMKVWLSHGNEGGVTGGCGLLVTHKIKPMTE